MGVLQHTILASRDLPTAFHSSVKGVLVINGLEHDIQLLFSQFLGWLLLLFHTVIVAGSPFG